MDAMPHSSGAGFNEFSFGHKFATKRRRATSYYHDFAEVASDSESMSESPLKSRRRLPG